MFGADTDTSQQEHCRSLRADLSHASPLQVGLLLLSKVVDSNPEAFKPHYRQLLRLFDAVLQDLSSPTALYYCILTLTAITAHTGQGELVSPAAV